MCKIQFLMISDYRSHSKKKYKRNSDVRQARKVSLYIFRKPAIIVMDLELWNEFKERCVRPLLGCGIGFMLRWTSRLRWEGHGCIKRYVEKIFVWVWKPPISTVSLLLISPTQASTFQETNNEKFNQYEIPNLSNVKHFVKTHTKSLIN